MSKHSSDEAWRQWGEQDPYYGVLTAPEFRRGALDQHRDEFFKTGRVHIDEVLRAVATVGGRVGGRALDFGCGVGRLLVPLSRRYEEVVGVDISEAMLAEAAANLKAAGAVRYELVVSDDGLTQANGAFDLVHSFIALQHIPASRGVVITRALLDRLQPGGAFWLHYTFSRSARFVQRLREWRHESRLASGLINLVRPSGNEPAMQMNEYDLPELLDLFTRAGAEQILMRPYPQGSKWGLALVGLKGSAA